MVIFGGENGISPYGPVLDWAVVRGDSIFEWIKSLLILVVKICLFYREMTLSKLDRKDQVTQTQLLNVSDFIMLSEGKYYMIYI